MGRCHLESLEEGEYLEVEVPYRPMLQLSLPGIRVCYLPLEALYQSTRPLLRRSNPQMPKI